ncbi:MAG: hypothetical protein EZS28_007287 [Streblomastix strix]|uniref:FH2 domain-containing protein n=1 Tax=Streblomastix strix TaxID=222440 RepID=A0A5J4WRK0_9EUKA|nr:MAG: hypothetical protein EZS28_007287 [Streblomastix strix]
MLSQFGSKTPEDIIKAITICDMSLLTPNRLQSLISLLPTEEEKDALLGFTGDPMNQTKAERFYLQLVKLERVEERLKFLLFRSRSAEIAEYLLPAYKSVIYACAELKGISISDVLVQKKQYGLMQLMSAQSTLRKLSALAESSNQQTLRLNSTLRPKTLNQPMFHQLLESILAIGNYLNGSSNQGCAYGCKLDVLSKICDFKGNDNKTTLLEYVILKIAIAEQKLKEQKEKDQTKGIFTSSLSKSSVNNDNQENKNESTHQESNQQLEQIIPENKLNLQTMDVQFITYSADRLNFEWRNVVKASKQSLPTLALDLVELNQGMLLVEKEIQTTKKSLNIRSNSPNKDEAPQLQKQKSFRRSGSTSPTASSSSDNQSGTKTYLKMLENFYSSFQSVHEEIKQCKEQCDKDVDDTIRVYNEDPAKLPSEEFFTIFTTFLDKVLKVAYEVKDREVARRKDIERKKREEQKKAEIQAKHDLFIQKSKDLGKTSLVVNSLQNLGSSDSLPQLEEKLIIDETIIKTPENPEPLKDLNKESKDNIDQIDQLSIDNSSKPTTVSQQDKDIQAIFGLGAQKGNIMSELNLKIVGGTLLMRKRNKNVFSQKPS